jgi:DNA-directed RNA polymerase specialized sigma subunit
MIRVLAFHLQGIRPDFFSPDIDDLMSDGAMGLLNAIRLSREGAMGFRFLCGREIKKAMFREEQTRRWGGRRRCEKIAVTRRIHAELTSTLGRLPTPEEMFERLKGLIGNPQLFVHGEQHVYSLSQSPREEGRPTQVAGDFPTPVERAIVAEESNQRPVDSEAIRLAGKKLDNRDRKILKALLAGQTAKEIAERFGLGYEGARNRINGILWVCRCNADLAAYLGVEAAEMPERKQGHMPWFPIPSGVLAG